MTAIRKVLFISADQWRGECLSAVGHPVVRTPHLDALAADGVLFRRHYTVTSPCGPSRSSLQTGLYLMNHRSGRNGTPLDRRHTNIAHEVRKAGMDPMLFGYTDTSADPRGLDPKDPALRTFEGPLPGYRIGMLFPDEPDPATIAVLETIETRLRWLGGKLPSRTGDDDLRLPAAAARAPTTCLSCRPSWWR